MQMRKGQIVEVEIERLAFGGRGIGKHNGMTVFVEGAIPGDLVEAAFTRLKKNFAEADLVKVVRPSQDRQEPKCPYFGVCGGCQLQHLPYEKQLGIKTQQVIDAFERIGKIYSPPVKPALPSPEPFYYRNKMEFSFGYDGEMKFALGLHLPDRRYDILDVKECYLQSEASVEIVNLVREFVKKKGWAPYKYSNGEGFLRSLFIRESKHTNDRMVNLATSDDVPEDVESGLAELVELLREKTTSIYWTQVISKRGTPKRLVEKHLFGEKVLREKMLLPNGDELIFEILPQAFFQVNTLQAEVLYNQVLELAVENDQEVVFDLFCGTGTIGLFLAKYAKKVVGIEMNEEAVKSALENAKVNEIQNIEFHVGDVEKVVKEIKEKPSLIVVDPPRAGLTEKMVENINEFGARKIIYVSCNPATLARDCQWFGDFGYKVKSVQPVDMFPQTYHIENVCLLEK